MPTTSEIARKAQEFGEPAAQQWAEDQDTIQNLRHDRDLLQGASERSEELAKENSRLQDEVDRLTAEVASLRAKLDRGGEVR